MSKCLDSQELGKHRALVGLRLEALAKKFDRFGWERDRGSFAHDQQVKDFMNALQDYPLDEIDAACAQAVLDNPSKMPNEGHIKRIIIAERKRQMPERSRATPPPSYERTDPARATQVAAELGLPVIKRITDVKTGNTLEASK